MKKIFVLLIIISVSKIFSQSDPFANLKFLVGNWAGEGSGFGNVKSKIESNFEIEMDGKYIEVINQSAFEPTERNEDGEKHKDEGFISYDKARNKIVYRQFNIEGYVNQYILNDSLSNDSTFVFVTENIENFVPGGSAKFTIKKIDDDNIVTVFDVSMSGNKYSCFGTNILTRQKQNSQSN